ncbi:MAG: polyprenol phosphomannose-dependent alpha 1,6 mannosyltransferase MptB [Acidimicrobiales bacterium]
MTPIRTPGERAMTASENLEGVLEAGSSVPERARPLLGRLSRLIDEARKRVDRGVGFLARMRTPLGEVQPYVRGETHVARLLAAPAIFGFLSSVAITWGASLSNSPFTWKTCTGIVPGSVTACRPWFFGIPPPAVVAGAPLPADKDLFIGLVAVYGGMVLMLQAWIALVRIARRHRGLPVRSFAAVFAAWTAPLLVVAPLFSRDAYSYAAQGEMMSRGINPYLFGPGMIGVNAFSGLVDKLWANVTSPYGPVFLWIAGVNATVVHHNELFAVVGFRVLAVVGVLMIAVFVPRLARSYGRDPAVAFVLAVLNPLVLLHLVAGAHNDALMLGCLVAGLALARQGRPVFGVLLCVLGAMIKIPAFLGVVYIGWGWLGDEVPWRSRLRPTITVAVLGAAVMTAVSQMVGLGWGWISALGNPGTVRSWLDPATAIGLWLAKLLAAIGLGNHQNLILESTRGAGLSIAAVIGAYLLWHAKGSGTLRAMGLTLLAVVVLGPTVQPWYLAWSVVILATVAEHRLRVLLIVLSCVSCFFGLPGARQLVLQFGEANPILIVFASIAMILLLAIPIVLRVRRALRMTEADRVLALPGG